MPGLAKICAPNEDLTEWTCELRQGVRFHDGTFLDANDVVSSFWVQWDASHPFRQGNADQGYPYFHGYWGEYLNAPSP